MKTKIQNYLKQLELDKQIKILLACETGSRAWGFHSPDSDYDVRIIYVHRKNWYLSVNQKKDFVEQMLENNDLDVTGWELKKSLVLLNKSNSSLLERIQSPIIYRLDEEFRTDILNVANQCYSKIATMHHYLSMSMKMLDAVHSSDKFKLKKLFYALRTATMCHWIIDKDEIPPIEFKLAYKNLNIDASVIKRIDELIDIKSSESESYLHTNEPLIMDYINTCISNAREHKNSLSTRNCQPEVLNKLLVKYIDKYDN